MNTEITDRSVREGSPGPPAIYAGKPQISPSQVFVTAEWRYLLMLNYRVNEKLLLPYLPAGTELDRWNGHTYISLIGFRFLKTRVWGWPFPWHRDFDEVNLRFYITRRVGDEIRRGVVFIKEVAPRAIVAYIAQALYNENYVTRAMRSHIHAFGHGYAVSYAWKNGPGWMTLFAETEDRSALAKPGTLPHFITEHYWGYSAQRDGGTLEYPVSHRPWRLWELKDMNLSGDATELYGENFADVLSRTPDCAFLADGSPVVVGKGKRV